MSLGIKGFTPTSLIDWPGKIAAVIFFSGCNFRCHYCCNPEFFEKSQLIKDIDDDIILGYLKAKKKWLDGVVFLGGEATINKNFFRVLRKVNDLGLGVCLHTNGTQPKTLKKMIENKQVEYIAMDIKAPRDSYKKVTDIDVNVDDIEESVKIIRNANSRIDYEFRTTVVPGLIDEDDIKEIGKWLKGAERYYIQQFRPGKTLDPKFKNVKPFTIPELLKLKKAARPYFKKVEIRGA